MPFQWTDLASHLENIAKPVFLAGGLTPENVGEAVRTLRPYGVDVSSGVERDRGVKDPALIEAFCEAVRRADASARLIPSALRETTGESGQAQNAE